jgi:hypothetical protein
VLQTNWEMRTRGVGLLFLNHKAGLWKAAVNAGKRGGMSVDECCWEGWKQLVGIDLSLG